MKSRTRHDPYLEERTGATISIIKEVIMTYNKTNITIADLGEVTGELQGE